MARIEWDTPEIIEFDYSEALRSYRYFDVLNYYHDLPEVIEAAARKYRSMGVPLVNATPFAFRSPEHGEYYLAGGSSPRILQRAHSGVVREIYLILKIVKR